MTHTDIIGFTGMTADYKIEAINDDTPRVHVESRCHPALLVAFHVGCESTLERVIDMLRALRESPKVDGTVNMLV